MTQRTLLAAYRRSILASFVAIILVLFACSNEDPHEPSSSSSEEPQSSSSKENSLLLNFTSNYESGELRWMNPESASLSTGAVSFNQDSKVSAGGGTIFVLGNFPGNVACILPEEIDDKSKIKQKELEAEAPFEATVIGDKGYIALNDENYVQVFDINTCTPSEKITLPASGASSIKASGDTLLVVLQRLENYMATKPGLLVRIKASTKSIIDEIPLNFYNPQSSILSNGKLYIPSIDDWFSFANSGIEVVDLATGTTDVLITSEQLGGGAYGIALDEKNQIIYAVVYEEWGSLPVKPINLSNKTVESALPNIVDASGGLVFDNVAKKLFIGDSNLKIYDPATKITTAVSQGANVLPPYSLAIVRW